LALAQGSAIAGVVKDATGAVLPGVTVEASSPVLIEKVRTVVTDAAGQYRIVDLRPGTYVVTFTLPGFTVVRQDRVELTTAFTATVDASLKVGGLEETITVSTATSVVDLSSVTQQRVATRAMIDAIPTGKTFQNIGVLIPGIVLGGGGTAATPNDVGGSVGEQQIQMGIHGGRTADMVIQMDGLRFNNLCGSGSYAGISGNDGAIQEIGFETSGASAEAGTGGVRINMIPKEGGNTFRGSFFTNWTNHSLQSNNYSQGLKDRGLEAPDTTERIWDINPTIGGPIRRNRLWFFYAHRYWGVDKRVADTFFDTSLADFVYTADRSRQAIDDAWNLSNSTRLTWQANTRNKINLFFDLQDRCTCHWFVGEGVAPEASWVQKTPKGHLLQVTWSSPVTSRLLVEGGFSLYDQIYTRSPQPEIMPAMYPILDQATGRRFGASQYYSEHESTTPVYRASMSYVTGTHAMKVGLNLTQGSRREYRRTNNDFEIRVNNGVPNRITLWATPLEQRERIKADLGVFAQDQWTIRRMTLNLGLRFDYFNAYVPAQSVAAGRFVPARTFAKVENVPNWKDISPRIGVVYDLFGNNRTAVKASVNRYVASQTVGIARGNNPVSATGTSAQRTWTDNGNFIPEGDFLNPAANGELGASNLSTFGQPIVVTSYDPNLLNGWFKRGYNWELATGVQHELAARVAVNVSYHRRWYGNFTVADNQEVTPADYEAYNIVAPVDPRLPNSGERITGLYTVNAAKFGRTRNVIRFASEFGRQSEVYNGVDLSLQARPTERFMFQGGTNTGRTATSSCFVVDSPGEMRFCKTIRPFLTQFKGLVAYTLPGDVMVSATLQSVPGPGVTASYTASNAEVAPSLGHNLPAGPTGTVTVALMQAGQVYGERFNQVDFRVAKMFRVLQGRRLQAILDVYNMLNADTVLLQNNIYGPEWQRPTAILPGRLLKVGCQLDW
jgi:hypothetical protein